MTDELFSYYRCYGFTLRAPFGLLDAHVSKMGRMSSGVREDIVVEVIAGEPDSVETHWVKVVEVDLEKYPSDRLQARFDSLSSGAVRYQMRSGRWIECDPRLGRLRIFETNDFDPEIVGAFVVGAAMIYYLKTCGFLCIHAAALYHDDRCVLLCGPSGAGKSTLAGMMRRYGWHALSEDLSVLNHLSSRATVRVAQGYLRLWHDSVRHLELTDTARPIISGAEKYYIDIGHGVDQEREVTDLCFVEARRSEGDALDFAPSLSVGRDAVDLCQQVLGLNANLQIDNQRDFVNAAKLVRSVSRWRLSLLNSFEQLELAAERLSRRLLEAGSG